MSKIGGSRESPFSTVSIVISILLPLLTSHVQELTHPVVVHVPPSIRKYTAEVDLQKEDSRLLW